ncbi:MAG: hypothetical protein AB7O52_09335 [Planctomycetota bacterium]
MASVVLAVTGGMAGDLGEAADPLARLVGAPAIVEFPELDDFEAPLPGVPAAWRCLQVTPDLDLAALRQRLGLTESFGLVFLDTFGNVLHREPGVGSRRRLGVGIREFEKRQKELRARVAELDKARGQAVAQRREGAEIEVLGQLTGLGVRGYPEVEHARQRMVALDVARWQQLVMILAGEGLVSEQQILGRLKELLDRSPGLPVADRILRERIRIQQGQTVERRSAP